VEFSNSQSDAIAASMHYLHRPVITEVVVAEVQPGGPSDGKLQTGDQMLTINGQRVSAPEDVRRLVRAHPPGSDVVVTVTRSGRPQAVTVTTAPSPTDPKVGYLGIKVAETYRATFPIDFTLQDVGGPSAGLMFSLGIVDLLTPGELNGGQAVAGTGTIDPQGVVGPIGGIRQKLAGARDSGAVLFLAPKSNCGEVVGHIPDGLQVVPVQDLSDAVSTVGAFAHGKGDTLPHCS